LRQVKSGPKSDKPAEVMMSFMTEAGFISALACRLSRGLEGPALGDALFKGVTKMLTALMGTLACLKA